MKNASNNAMRPTRLPPVRRCARAVHNHLTAVGQQ
jgi:hypothetical protein